MDESNVNKLSLVDNLYICNLNMPSLEEFVHWADSGNENQREIVISWYKEFIKKSEIYKNFCYLDLTFEVPQKGGVTLIFSSNEAKDYTFLLNEFVENKNTLYIHPSFKNGTIGNKDSNHYHFYFSKLTNENSNLIEKTNPSNSSSLPEIILQEFDLGQSYAKWSKNDFDSLYESTVDSQFIEWYNIHSKYAQKLKSISGKNVNQLFVVPIGILDHFNNFQLIGGLYLGVDDECDSNKVYSFIRSLLLQLITNFQRYESKRAYSNALRSAKVAIMGRNMSHNIGSHVIYYLRQHLNGDFKQMQQVLDMIELVEGDANNPDKVTVKFKGDFVEIDRAKLELPFLRGLGTFLTYIQERQDFIATISSHHFPAFNKVNFKSFIVDNFLKDLRAKRHKKEGNNTTKDEINILLNYIAKSEDVTVNFTFNGYSLDGSPLDSSDTTKKIYDIFVDLPGSTLGRQAIYSILENVIRNAAKHGKRVDGSNVLRMDMSVTYSGEDGYVLKISDNNIYSNGLANKLNDFLKTDIIDGQYKLIESHKGLKEIAISSVWLSGVDFSLLPKEEINNYIKITNGTNKEDSISIDEKIEVSEIKKLTFEIKLLSSKDLLIVSDMPSIQQIENLEYITKDEILSNPKKYVRYNMILHITSEENLSIRTGFRTYYRISLEEYDSCCSKLNCTNAYSYFYETYVKKEFYLNQDFPEILINVNDGSMVESSSKTNSTLQNLINENPGSIYYNETHVPQGIAFRRHISEDFSKFFQKTKFENEFKDFLSKLKNTEKLGKRHEPADLFQLINEAKKNFLSLENISGDNSSYRILVNDPKDDEWVLRKLEAAKAKILIIDERLYDTNRYCKQGKLSDKALSEIKSLLGIEFVSENIDFIYDSTISYYEEKIKFYNEKYKAAKSISYLNSINKVYGEVLNIIEEALKNRENTQHNVEKSIQMEFKNIIIGNYTYLDNSILDLFESNIGSIELRSEDYTVTFNSKFDERFDYISIHQSIIDKLIERNDILNKKDNSFLKEKDDKDIKKIISEKFCFALSKECKKLVIHTGRGKPNYLGSYAAYRSLSDLDYALNEPKEILLDYFKSASYDF